MSTVAAPAQLPTPGPRMKWTVVATGIGTFVTAQVPDLPKPEVHLHCKKGKPAKGNKGAAEGTT